MWAAHRLDLAIGIGGASSPAPSPLVSIDFKNGVYDIGGVSKTLGEVVVQNLNWSPYSASDVVAGVGYRKQNASGGAGPVLSAEAYAAVGYEFVALINYKFIIGVAAVGTLQVQLGTTNLPPYSNFALLSVGDTFYGYTSIEDLSGVRANLGTDGYSDGAHAAAVRFGTGEMAVSFDGAAATVATVQDQSGSNSIVLYADCTGSTDSSAIIEKMEFYPLADFASTDLPALSGG